MDDVKEHARHHITFFVQTSLYVLSSSCLPWTTNGSSLCILHVVSISLLICCMGATDSEALLIDLIPPLEQVTPPGLNCIT